MNSALLAAVGFRGAIVALGQALPEILITAGAALCLLGCLGLLRMPDVFGRLQVSATCLGAGTCLVLLGVALRMGVTDHPGCEGCAAKAGLCVLVVLIAGPVATHAIARAAHRAGVRQWDGAVGDEYLKDRSGGE